MSREQRASSLRLLREADAGAPHKFPRHPLFQSGARERAQAGRLRHGETIRGAHSVRECNSQPEASAQSGLSPGVGEDARPRWPCCVRNHATVTDLSR